MVLLSFMALMAQVPLVSFAETGEACSTRPGWPEGATYVQARETSYDVILASEAIYKAWVAPRVGSEASSFVLRDASKCIRLARHPGVGSAPGFVCS